MRTHSFMLAVIALSACAGMSSYGQKAEADAASRLHAPWVSCSSQSETGDGTRQETKTVRTPPLISPDGKLQAFAQIEAKAAGQAGCNNTVRLFVSNSKQSAFRQVFVQEALPQSGDANSLGPIAWSRDGRWLLVEFLQGSYYGSDAGGIGVLLYDNRKDKVVLPDLDRMVKAALKQECSVRLIGLIGFDTRSRIQLQITDDSDVVDSQPFSHCFRGVEEWTLDPVKGAMQLNVPGR